MWYEEENEINYQEKGGATQIGNVVATTGPGNEKANHSGLCRTPKDET